MKYRKLGKTGLQVSEISLGTWQVGGRWGDDFSNRNADEILNKAVDEGVNFIDTADVYGDGLSEKAVGRLIKTRKEQIYVASKCGRKLDPHTADAYTPAALRTFVEDSLRNMGLETIDLIQLHCPPTDVFYKPEIFELFDRLKDEGKIRFMGVSIEKVEEGLKAMQYSNVCTIQLIYNIFRQRPNELLFAQAKRNNIGLIARVPLASGLLTGKFDHQSSFTKDDHRNFNRNGEQFDKGETFSGVDYDKGLAAVEQLKQLFPNVNLPSLALRWILASDEISCVIPGASNVTQLQNNITAANDGELNAIQIEKIKHIYEQFIKAEVHQRW
ncbi:aldo/keto reductase [Pelobium manganitolerans]|uniref:Aldo/keto reductase n=1 Tax=Pelobium manganitolerans TaxID=1842495 RepID=A0A419SAM5_9SPHI|nr:aldo/keto reductase [Pelobium manganitolerans]RKD19523.1 aldo/keto reductase [Pelobium manganitolerans]